MAGSDIGSDTIKVRRVSSWRANWSASGSGQAGTNIFQLVLDDGAAEAVLALTTDDADNLFDWLSASSDVHYDVEREVLMFGPTSIG